MVVVIACIALVVFVVFRVIANRRAENRAEQLVSQAVNTPDSASSESGSNTDQQGTVDPQSNESSAPSGVADDVEHAPGGLPNVGAGAAALWVATLASIATYAAVMVMQRAAIK